MNLAGLRRRVDKLSLKRSKFLLIIGDGPYPENAGQYVLAIRGLQSGVVPNAPLVSKGTKPKKTASHNDCSGCSSLQGGDVWPLTTETIAEPLG
jgi:hypothetical protein